jgi:hypothetical protein
MATNKRVKLGTMPCEGANCDSHNINRPVVVYQSESGTLGYKCDICGRGYYVKKEDAAHAEWMEAIVKIIPDTDIEPSPAAHVAAPITTPQAAPLAKAVKGFSLGEL